MGAIIAPGRVTVTVDGTSAGNIGNITTTNPGNIVIARDITIGRVILDNGNNMTAAINNGAALTLSGVNHTGLGAVTLNGATATLTIQDAATVHNTINGAGVDQGILNLGIGSTVNGKIGNTNSLATVNIAAGEVNINHNVSAANTTLIAGSVLKLAAGKTIDGAIKNISGVDGKGTLTFLGAGGVTGNIGEDTLALAQINIGANAGGEVILGGNVYTKKLVFNNASNVKIAGNFGGGAKVGGAAGAAGEVDFGAVGVGGTLTFNGGRGVGDLKTFNATIANGANGTLNVLGKLQATHADIGNIKTINIGDADEGYLTIDASAGNVDLLNADAAAAGPGVAINFLNADSELRLLNTNAAGKTITFYGNLEGVAGGGGIVSLEGPGTPNHTLTLDSDGAVALRTLGATRLLTRLDVRGQVNIAHRAANKLDIHHVPELNVIKSGIYR